MVYVLNQNGQPVMPTSNHAKVRILLKTGKAKVIKRCPFTIQLKYSSTNYTQEVSLGVDAGSKHIGISATTENKVLYEADVELRNDIVDLISTRRQNRRTRRNRKTRYRKPRFNNRVSAKKEGWLAPSVKQKVDTHLTVVAKVHQMLPISKIVVKTASFDIQKIKNPAINCHTQYHKGNVQLPTSIKRGASFKDSSFMGVMRWTFYNELKSLYQNVGLTYGYITKNTRIKNNLPKEHFIDARCISGNPSAVSDGTVYYQKKVRCHNRQIHKNTILKGGIRKRNQAPYFVKGFRLFDKVLYKGRECFIFGRRSTGRMDLRLLDGTHINASVGHKNIRLIDSRKNYITERRMAVPPTGKPVGFPA